MTQIERLEAEYGRAMQSARAVAARIHAQAAGEQRSLTDSEKRFMAEEMDRTKPILARLERAKEDRSMTQQIDNMLGGGPRHRATVTGPALRGASLGELFIQSSAYKWLQEHKGSLPEKWASPSAEVYPNDLYAATLTSDTGSPGSGGDLIIPDYQRGIVPGFLVPYRVADLIAGGTTDSNAIGYFEETTYTNNADTVAEAAAKPESEFIFDAATDPVRKIAHWIPVTDEMLEDVPGLRSYLDIRLRRGVQVREDNQLLNGNGNAPNIRGLLNRTGLATTIVAGGSPGSNNADAIAEQISAIANSTDFPPDGIIMNATDWLGLQLMKDADNNYIGNSPFQTPLRTTLWGLPVAVTAAIAAGTALVGAFGTAAQIFRKGGIRVEASNSHSDFFVKNLTAIRAEERLALACYVPGAFGTVTLT